MSARLLLLCLLFRSSWLTVEGGRGRRRHSAASLGRTGSRGRVGRRGRSRSRGGVLREAGGLLLDAVSSGLEACRSTRQPASSVQFHSAVRVAFSRIATSDRLQVLKCGWYWEGYKGAIERKGLRCIAGSQRSDHVGSLQRGLPVGCRTFRRPPPRLFRQLDAGGEACPCFNGLRGTNSRVLPAPPAGRTRCLAARPRPTRADR